MPDPSHTFPLRTILTSFSQFYITQKVQFLQNFLSRCVCIIVSLSYHRTEMYAIWRFLSSGIQGHVVRWESIDVSEHNIFASVFLYWSWKRRIHPWDLQISCVYSVKLMVFGGVFFPFSIQKWMFRKHLQPHIWNRSMLLLWRHRKLGPYGHKRSMPLLLLRVVNLGPHN
jgi:hypothetical protein